MSLDSIHQHLPDQGAALSRRQFLTRAGHGLGAVALSHLVKAEAASVPSAGSMPLPHFAPRAKRCIFLFMVGGPSQMELFDPKPALDRLHGQRLPASFGKIHSQFLEQDPICLGSTRGWARCGQSGMDMSDLIPHMHQHADTIALVRSCAVDSVIHAPAHYQMNSGRMFMGHPSLGSWVTYGLGSLSENLPSFVVMAQPQGTPEGGAPCWSSGYLPAKHQGTLFRPGANPIVNLASNDPAFSRSRQRRIIDFTQELNRRHLTPGDTDLEARISSYELAFQMQAEAPGAVDLTTETAATRSLYGMDKPATAEFGTRCLIARRLLERGVRFVQLYSGGGPVAWQWDAHDDVNANHERMCGATDQPVAALLTDLKRRGLLDDTLVIWGGEFGRTPVSQKGSRGRDHNATGFSMWFAGGGVRPGITYGATDEIGLNAIEGRAHIHDIHATILHLMGLDHTRLIFPHGGRDERLTDVHGEVITGLLS
ncbi:MAG: DUF1501 domain-containing protein [Verrucomicrobiales bacterium]|nr:DUF1501 domain-containing protein [Verrucomicrobiales bacterium]